MTVVRPLPRSHPLPFLFTGLLVLAASVWVFLLILRGVYGRIVLADFVPSKENLSMVFTKRKIGILESRYSDLILPEGSAWLHDNVNTWKKFLASTGAHYEILYDQTIETGQIGQYSVLILPGSRALSDREAEAIKQYIDQGGSVFATGGTGTFTEHGDWRGWQFLSQVFGLQFTREITLEQKTRLHTLRGDLPTTGGIPAGYSLRVATWDNPIACRVLEPRTTQVSTWYNFRSDSGLARESIESTAGIVYGTYGLGRYVWMGFELNSVLGNQDDYVYFDLLCRHCIDWLDGTPTVQVKEWPRAYRAAAMVVLPVEDDSVKEQSLVASASQHKVPLCSFLSPYVAPGLGFVGELAKSGDLGALVREAGAVAQMPLQTGPPMAAAWIMSGPPTDTVLYSMLARGWQYVVVDSVSDRAVPRKFSRGDQDLVVFSQTARGDEEVVGQYGLTDTSLQFYTYREDVDRVLFQGGLYLLQVHANLQGRPEYAPVLNSLWQYLREKGFWIASGSEISQWWLARSAVNVNVRPLGRKRIALLISNTSRKEVRDAVVQLTINRPAWNVVLTSDILGTVIPPFRFNSRTQVLDLTIPRLEGGAILSLFVDFDQPPV
jgi:hypothetical protein